jgi:polyhydroxyalkanoate synthesis repressor PhaR
MAIIKRYPNRKLYDTDAKRYVTLDEIAVMVRNGAEVQVIDHETGEDVTSLTLTQIILEQEKKKSGYLSTSALAGLIRSGGASLGNSIGDTLDSLKRSVQSVQSSVQKSVASLGEMNPISEERINRLIEQGKLNVEQAQGLLKLDGLLTEVLHSLNVPTQQEIQALQEQIESLSERLADLSAEESSAQEFSTEEFSTEDLSAEELSTDTLSTETLSTADPSTEENATLVAPIVHDADNALI